MTHFGGDHFGAKHFASAHLANDAGQSPIIYRLRSDGASSGLAIAFVGIDGVRLSGGSVSLGGAVFRPPQIETETGGGGQPITWFFRQPKPQHVPVSAHAESNGQATGGARFSVFAQTILSGTSKADGTVTATVASDFYAADNNFWLLAA